MVTAIVLIRAERQKLQETAERLLEVDAVKEVAFKCFSRRDLERMWGIGLDEERAI